MERLTLTVLDNRQTASGIFEMRLGGCSAACRAGQFVNLEVDGFFLRRPISVCDWEDGVLTLAYRVVGEGTAAMAAMAPGTRIDTLAALGNGFDTGVPCREALLAGGGIGLAPLYKLTRELVGKGVGVTVVAGFRTASEIFREEAFVKAGARFIVATEDGSRGVRGFVTDALREEGLSYDYIFSCGPLPMMKALCAATTAPAQMSLEERMGCGFGICMGCTCRTSSGAKRICKEGPVFKREEIIW
ncbi:MAG: dihydroorotate dehydrogenase electron transfer subunit [Candidatus Cryptobacteroides sp.]